MQVGRKLRAGVQAIAAPTLFLALVGYFGWNATQGERGLQSYALRQEQLKSVQADLAKVTLDKDALERRVAGLRNQRLDADTLDERARLKLNVGDPADIVIQYGPAHKVF